jgi:hypothetical protein
MFKHGLDRRAASYTSTVLFVLFLLALVYLIRETLFVFALALLRIVYRQLKKKLLNSTLDSPGTEIV